MRAKILIFLFTFVLTSCVDVETSDLEFSDSSIEDSQENSNSNSGGGEGESGGELTGSQLYQVNCQTCHGEISQSAKIGATVTRISDAIANNSVMKNEAYLAELKSGDIQKISSALNNQGNGGEGSGGDGPVMVRNQVLGTSNFVASKFTIIFNTSTTNQVIADIIQDLIKTDSRVAFGGLCTPGEDHCIGEVEARVNALMSPNSQVVRSATLHNACQKILAVDQSVRNALELIGLSTSSAANSANVSLVHELFFPGITPSSELINELISIYVQANANGSSELSSWRMMMDPMCKSNLFEMF